MRIRLCAIALCFLSVGIAAHADDLFTLTSGGDTITFILPTSPTGTVVASHFTVSPVSLYINGTRSNQAISFYLLSDNGGFSIQDPGQISDKGTGLVLDQQGAQLFAGTTANPVFTPGTYDLTHETDEAGVFNGDFTLTITPTVPEPSSLALLGTGVLGLVGAVRRRLA